MREEATSLSRAGYEEHKIVNYPSSSNLTNPSTWISMLRLDEPEFNVKGANLSQGPVQNASKNTPTEPETPKTD
jgi:hypothetical protein